MKVFYDDFSRGDFYCPILTIGAFDGIHLGHRKLLERTLYTARKIKGQALVMTFEPHPLKVLYPERTLKLITPIEEKLRLLKETGIDAVIVYPFSLKFAQTPPEGFVEEVLYKKIGPKRVIVGYNFTFGRNRSGTAEVLGELGTNFGFEVEVIPPYEKNGKPVSSSWIRQLIAEGRIEEANELLGRNFSVRGTVIQGRGRGKTLGAPTANLKVHQDQILPLGVYAVRVYGLAEGPMPGVANIGRKPTFGEEDVTFEIHVIGFSGDLYGKELLVEFSTKIREERAFPTIKDLSLQIQKDIEKALELLGQMKDA